jgi:hypothetical protein
MQITALKKEKRKNSKGGKSSKFKIKGFFIVSFISRCFGFRMDTIPNSMLEPNH